MNKKILATAIAATCATGAVHMEASAADKAKSQSLGDLSCQSQQVAEFDGELWACIDTPSGAGGAPEYQFVDDDGNILGDVVYVEDGFTAWGYIAELSTISTIQVTATVSKGSSGWEITGNRLAGNLKPVRVRYESINCSGSGYLADYELGLSFGNSSNPNVSLLYPPFLAFLETEPVYYLPDTPPASTWTEVILGEVTGVYDFGSYNFTSDLSNCVPSSKEDTPATQIESLGIPIDAPVMPISVVEK
jgi:hypothetical protein